MASTWPTGLSCWPHVYFCNVPLRIAISNDVLEKMTTPACKDTHSTHSMGNPPKQLISSLNITMWSRKIKYLCLFTGVIKLHSIMSQALPNDCWKLSNNRKTHKKYRINKVGRKLWENSLWLVEMGLHVEIIWNNSIRIKKNQVSLYNHTLISRNFSLCYCPLPS